MVILEEKRETRKEGLLAFIYRIKEISNYFVLSKLRVKLRLMRKINNALMKGIM